MNKEQVLAQLKEKQEAKLQEYMKQAAFKSLKESAESEKKLKTLGQQYPEAADAAAQLVREYISNPKKPMNQIITKVAEETGVNKQVIQKFVAELGLGAE